MRNRITLKDIARETGVHVSTVSRALDPNAPTPLTKDVVARVRAAADALGYQPNRLASGLRTNRTMTVGVMIPDITNTLFPPIVRGIESVLEPLGYASIIVNTDSVKERESRLVGVLRERGVDGIIHTAALRSDPKISEAAAAGLPVIALNRKTDSAAIPSIINDETVGIRHAFQHLFDHGHRRIAHIAGPQDLSTGQMRREAFERVRRELGLPASACPIVEAKRFDEAEGRRCASRLITLGKDFTAVLCANDRLALGAIDQLKSIGLICPVDISVTGFNDMPMLDLIPPRLTTVRIQQFEAGQVAANMLYALMSDSDTDVPTQTILPVELVVRDSVAPPRR